ncbi:uncharacterized protein F4817DRAFT_335326 [Daldinia loculata]|uniref:uncharacterized protein n=1 Tax=Daldinia loculata TaxID=103429 RepID=UPI0020C3E519|nr:uncharacterized protein F4817DRAFT_335326 [Daldinia loculata]KAI1648220.1 hypothetical protein F4817DRAFT_335326 [Daldinia loculata]
MAPSKAFTYCEGVPSWNPTTYIADAALHERAEAFLASDDFQSAVIASFALPHPRRDSYVYHAIVSVTLAEVQHIVSLGRQNAFHAWYFEPAPAPAPAPSTEDDGAKPEQTPSSKKLRALPPPPRPDIDAYLSIFDPSTSTPSALKTFLSNAKKGSLRAEIASYLQSKRYLHPALASQLTIPKQNKTKNKNKTSTNNNVPPNPYLTFLNWSCRNLEWAGPSVSSTLAGNRSHHVLPVLMHHFGCACPSHEALSILRVLAAGREVLDLGSGGGYWSFMLRQYGVRAVPVDSAQSAWRVNWVSDTTIADGAEWLRKRRRNNNSTNKSSAGNSKTNTDIDPDEGVLLLVYPIVGGTIAGGEEGGFTRLMMDAYSGDTLAVVGTQNHNGYTGFRGLSMDEYIERERAGEGWVKVVQVALPSFPGKDEALFVFQRGTRAPTSTDDDTNVASQIDDSSGSNLKKDGT